MTAVAITRAASVPDKAHVTFLHELRSEWIKLTSLRSTPWILGTAVVLMTGFAALGAWGYSTLLDNPEMQGGGPPIETGPAIGTAMATSGWMFGQIVVAVLGTMIITGEYSTGQIRSTLASVPTRLPVLWAKSLVAAGVAFVAGLLASALGALVTTPFLSGHGAAVDLSAEGTVQSLLGMPLYLAAATVLALGIGAMIRNTAGGIAVSVVLLFVLPLILPNISLDFFADTTPYMPSLAGQRLIEGEMDGATLTPWEGYGVMLAWVAAALAGAAVLLRRRDA